MEYKPLTAIQNKRTMKNIRIEIKWAIIFSIMGLLWMVLEKWSGLHGEYIDYHLYLTNLFAIPAIIVMVMALQDKKKHDYGGQMSYMQGLVSGIIVSAPPSTCFPIIFCPIALHKKRSLWTKEKRWPS